MEISEKIFLIFQKIKNRIVLEQDDLNILTVELKKIYSMGYRMDDLHDAIVCALHILENKIYNDYKQKMNDAEVAIENHFFEGNKLTNTNAFEEYYNGNFNDILNFQKIKIYTVIIY